MKKQDTKTSPPVKVVGFRVEGATPSPRDSALADAADAINTLTGSPSPVIIPPAFTAAPRGGDSTPRMQPVAASSPPSVSSSGPFQLDMGDEAAAAGLPPIRTDAAQGLDRDAFAQERTPTKAQAAASPHAGGGGRPLPLTPVGTSAPAELGGPFAGAAADSPRVMQAPLAEPAPSAPPTLPAAAPTPAQPAVTSPRRQQAAAAPQAPPPAAGGAAAAAGGGEGGAARGPPPGEGGKKPLKEMTKAERRALQEAQRAAKAAAKAGGGGGAGGVAGGGGAGKDAAGKGLQKSGSSSSLARQPGAPSRQVSSVSQEARTGGGDASARGGRQAGGGGRGAGAKAAAAAVADAPPPPPAKSAEMFAHLPQPRGVTLHSVAAARGPPVPMAAVKLGLRYADGSVRGANARCIAMLQTFVQCIQEFRTPPGREFAKEFSPALNNIINFLVSCRPLSISMGNAIKCVKAWLEKMKLQPPPSEQQAKDELVERISDYLEQKIRFADRMLVKHGIEKIQDGDSILTYAYSSVVAATLLAAHKAGKRFDVVVVDSRPLFEGRRMLTTLLEAGITCEYCHLGALSYEITEVDKVFLGAGSVLSNGAVLSRVGSAAVALMAAAQRVPVLVCCETYKFHERVQLDSITHNELWHAAGLAHVQDRPDVPDMVNWQENEKVHLLNLAYDLLPADFVTVVVTEMGAVPATSVAVILREAQRDSALL